MIFALWFAGEKKKKNKRIIPLDLDMFRNVVAVAF